MSEDFEYFLTYFGERKVNLQVFVTLGTSYQQSTYRWSMEGEALTEGELTRLLAGRVGISRSRATNALADIRFSAYKAAKASVSHG